MNLLRVNMAGLTAQSTPLSNTYTRWGGRGLTAAIISQEVPATSDPLGKENKLVIAPGLLAGRGISSAGRISIGAKSPLTGGIKESNAGGNAANNLIRLGFKTIVIEDQPAPDCLYLLRVGAASCELQSADEYRGLANHILAEKLLARFGRKNTLVLLGPAGEMGLKSAGIALTDQDGKPGRLAARGGLGAVMGAKGLKAIIIEETRGKTPPSFNPKGVKDAIQRYTHSLLEDYYTSTVFPELGTPYMVIPMHKLGGLPTRNFSAGTFEDLSELTGEAIRDAIKLRGGAGKITHACMAGCVVRCSNVVPDAEGKIIVAPIEYESMIMLGPNLGIGSLDAIAHFNRRCNELGVDTVDVGGAIGIVMESGLLPFGGEEGVFDLLDQIERGTTLGRMIGDGTATTGRELGATRIPAVKGQCIAAYDPRAVKGLGVTYATSPMGADHTAGHTADFPVDHHSPEGKVELSRQAQVTAAAWDTLGLCSFVTGATAPQMGNVVDILRAIDGYAYPDDQIEQIGRQVLAMERQFNRAAGFTPADDRLPEFFEREALPPFNVVFDVRKEDLDNVFNWDQ